MKKAPDVEHQSKRIESLQDKRILDTLPEKRLYEITVITLQICETPITLISLFDQKNASSNQKMVSSNQIPQVIMNLLSNSLDAIHLQMDRWINIDIGLEANMVKITFTNSGSGIHDETAKKLMISFFTTKEVEKGTSLSLSIAKGIVDSHTGTLIHEKHGRHTTFVLKPPLRQKQNPLRT